MAGIHNIVVNSFSRLLSEKEMDVKVNDIPTVCIMMGEIPLDKYNLI